MFLLKIRKDAAMASSLCEGVKKYVCKTA